MTHFELLKYAATGIASPGMTAYDKMRALAMAGGGAIKTLTGVPPLSFRANGKPLISWSMLGNGQQDGTPTPDAPVDVVGCGDRTENLLDTTSPSEYVRTTGAPLTNGGIILSINNAIWTAAKYENIPVTANSTYTITIYIDEYSGTGKFMIPCRQIDGAGTTIFTDTITSTGKKTHTFTAAGSTVWLGLYLNNSGTAATATAKIRIMLSEGELGQDYEPYGWKIPVTSAGQTVPVYLGQVQTVRRVKKLVLDGTENWVMSAAWEKPNTEVYFFELAGINTAGSTSTAWIYSDRFPAKSRDDLYNADYNCIARTGSIAITVRVNKSTAPTRDDFKAWLSQQSAAGAPVTIWYILANKETSIVNEPLCKIGDYADTLDSADAGITIPTTRGSNTLTVDTDLQPSSMTITYR